MSTGLCWLRSLLNRNARHNAPALLIILAFLASAPTARALVIIPVWDSSITNDPNAAIIESSINMAIQYYEARFADPFTFSIQFEEMSGGLGESEWSYYNIPYSQFITALQADATTTNDTYALSFLPAGPNNPVTGDANINVHEANLWALGLASYYGLTPDLDSTISLNTSIMNLSRTSIDPSKFDLIAVAEHEMDEVLAFASDLPNNDDPFPQDLFRYASDGTRSFTTSGDDAYFSLDGTNLLVQFNQNSGGDYGDWWSFSGPHTPRVQDAFATQGATPNPNVELIGLDVIGYDLVPPPQPIILSSALSGTNLVLNGTNGLATGVYHVLASTNLTLPLNQWSSVATNSLTANGSFTITATNAVKRNSTSQFYVLQLQ
ncbi:MAG TPA: NF038122 family metalloprotease [Verrucomicrobiae bacterium]|jgi:hypothetical protein|nr:NF038122 family metalloprotease [Verrucomicrobiae bacterium]